MQHRIDLSLGHGAEGERLLKCLIERPGLTLLFGATDTVKRQRGCDDPLFAYLFPPL